ncbi:MAG: hypothetical protein K6V97_14360 [Actinomycetia bacterium]|nr:hypothetical protein [Actinomycetes bacterium]
MTARRRRRLRPRFFLVLLLAAALVAVLLHRSSPHPGVGPSAPARRVPAPAAPRWQAASWSLPTPAEGLAAAAAFGDVVAAGGWSGTSLGTIRGFGPHPFAADLAVPVHDAAAAVLDGTLYVVGGGQSASLPVVQALAAGASRAEPARALPEPLSDVGAVVWRGAVYVVGGYTGQSYSARIWRWTPGAPAEVAAVLPVGVRYAGVALYHDRLIVAGGITPRGRSAAVWSVDLATGTVRPWPALPTPTAYPPPRGTETVLTRQTTGTPARKGSTSSAPHPGSATRHSKPTM